jgi:hypothetical protein
VQGRWKKSSGLRQSPLRLRGSSVAPDGTIRLEGLSATELEARRAFPRASFARTRQIDTAAVRSGGPESGELSASRADANGSAALETPEGGNPSATVEIANDENVELVRLWSRSGFEMTRNVAFGSLGPRETCEIDSFIQAGLVPYLSRSTLLAANDGKDEVNPFGISLGRAFNSFAGAGVSRAGIAFRGAGHLVPGRSSEALSTYAESTLPGGLEPPVDDRQIPSSRV